MPAADILTGYNNPQMIHSQFIKDHVICPTQSDTQIYNKPLNQLLNKFVEDAKSHDV